MFARMGVKVTIVCRSRLLPKAEPEVAQALAGYFRDEDIEYARRLGAAGVSAELHVHPGAPHGFERAAPNSNVGRRAMADRHRVLLSL